LFRRGERVYGSAILLYIHQDRTGGENIQYFLSFSQIIFPDLTGIGCGLSAVTGAFCAVSDGELLAATAAAFGFYGLCGDLAIEISDKPGSFFVAFIDMLYSIQQNDIDAFLKVGIVQ